MSIRIMETSPERLRQIARDCGIKPVRGQALEVIHAAIAAAYQREIDAEERRVMHPRAVRLMREAG